MSIGNRAAGVIVKTFFTLTLMVLLIGGMRKGADVIRTKANHFFSTTEIGKIIDVDNLKGKNTLDLPTNVKKDLKDLFNFGKWLT